MATDYANLIPPTVARELIDAAIEESAVMRLARTIRMPSGMVNLPVPSLMPQAGFVAARGGRKPATVIEWSAEQLTPEEIAVVTAIPNDFLEDNGFPVWDEVRPLLGQAIAQVLDAAALWGSGAPASWPVGGIEAAAAGPVSDVTFYDAISAAMGEVEESGTLPTGHVHGPGAGHALRTLRDENGNLVFTASPGQGQPNQLFGLPLTRSWSWESDAELLTGDWTKAVLGIRQDIRFDMSTEGVLTDDEGVVTVNAFQDDSTLMRAYMRVGFAIGLPVNPSGDPVTPFAFAEATPSAPGGSPAAASRASSSPSSTRKPRSSRKAKAKAKAATKADDEPKG